MSINSIFEVIETVMIGPSSSHTMGAVRLGSFCRQFGADDIENVTFTLYGSFAYTYKGHGTDKALLGGLLGFAADDENIKLAYSEAENRGLHYQFIISASDEFSGNTVRFDITQKNGECHSIIGESVGGGRINVFMIDGMRVDISGQYTSLVTMHKDVVGMLAKITAVLSAHNINIAFLKLFREERFSDAILVAQTDETIAASALEEINKIPGIKKAIIIQPI